MKCLLLEDDVVLLHDLSRTREILVQNTLTLFNRETVAYDCTKRGFGWLRSTHTGMGSQCQIFSKDSTTCVSECLGTDAMGVRVDTGLKVCQVKCGLVQKRFLLVVYGGLRSTMEREEVR